MQAPSHHSKVDNDKVMSFDDYYRRKRTGYTITSELKSIVEESTPFSSYCEM